MSNRKSEIQSLEKFKELSDFEMERYYKLLNLNQSNDYKNRQVKQIIGNLIENLLLCLYENDAIKIIEEKFFNVFDHKLNCNPEIIRQDNSNSIGLSALNFEESLPNQFSNMNQFQQSQTSRHNNLPIGLNAEQFSSTQLLNNFSSSNMNASQRQNSNNQERMVGQKRNQGEYSENYQRLNQEELKQNEDRSKRPCQSYPLPTHFSSLIDINQVSNVDYVKILVEKLQSNQFSLDQDCFKQIQSHELKSDHQLGFSMLKSTKDQLFLLSSNQIQEYQNKELHYKTTLYIKDNIEEKYFSTGLILGQTHLILACAVNPTIFTFKINENFDHRKVITSKDNAICFHEISPSTFFAGEVSGYIEYINLPNPEKNCYFQFPFSASIFDIKQTMVRKNEFSACTSTGLHFFSLNDDFNGKISIQDNKESYFKDQSINSQFEFQPNQFALCFSRELDYVKVFDRVSKITRRSIKNPNRNLKGLQVQPFIRFDKEMCPFVFVRDEDNLTLVNVNKGVAYTIFQQKHIESLYFSKHQFFNEMNEQENKVVITLLEYENNKPYLKRYELTSLFLEALYKLASEQQ